MSARIVITTFGSFGDVHPYLALARGLRGRGHVPVLAAAEFYRDVAAREGIEFRAVRPTIDPTDSALVARIMEPWRGSEVIIGEVVMPHLAEAYADLEAVVRAERPDLLLSHPITFAAPVLAERLGLRWLSTVLAPMSFFSAHDLPVFPPVPWLQPLASGHLTASRALVRLARASTGRLAAPVHALRARLGLPRTAANPVFEGQFSPHGTLALFSPLLGRPQPDWPSRVQVTGQPFYDGAPGDDALPDDLQRFLDAGTPPIVFTLGTSAVGTAARAARFFAESVAAAQRLGRRAVLLVGRDPRARPDARLPAEVLAVPYAPHAPLFARALAVVHQGGIGTTAQALRAGHPTLVVPWAHDQPDNAHRVARLGVSRTLLPSRYDAARVAHELEALLADAAYRTKAEEVARLVRAEDGVGRACDAIEAALR